MIFRRKTKEKKSKKREETDEVMITGEDGMIDPVSTYLSLLSGEKSPWKTDEQAKDEYYRLKFEHEQILCGFAAGVFESLRTMEYPK